MQVIVSSTGETMDSAVSTIFGRCAFFVLVDTDTMLAQAFPNEAQSASGGAGIQAAQFVVGKAVQAVITGNVGPNAMEVLQAAEVAVYQIASGTVEAAVSALKQGQLQAAGGATTAADTGKSTFPGLLTNTQTGVGRDMGAGRGGGQGGGHDGGHGGGQGGGRGGSGGGQGGGPR